MASTLASQLQSLQQNRPSTLSSTVDPKALRKLHSVSLLFTPEYAAGQDFDAIYALCYEGFEELCSLDPRFVPFGRSLFSEQSINIDRDILGQSENDKLNENVKAFLGLLGAWALVKSGVKALEWLVRRFRIHHHNTSIVLLTFLPYHQHPFFLRLLSIIPQPLPDAFRFLASYRKNIGTPIPRTVLIQSLTTRPQVFELLSQHVINTISAGHGHATLTRFWSALSVETLSAMLDRTATKSRTGITTDDVARQFLPIISESLEAGTSNPEFQIGTYMLLSLLSSRMALQDDVICATMCSVVDAWNSDTVIPAIAALALLSQQRDGMAPTAPYAVAAAFLKVESIAEKLLALGEKYRVDKLAVGISLTILEHPKLQNEKSAAFIKAVFRKGRITPGQKEAIVRTLVEKLLVAEAPAEAVKGLLEGFRGNDVLVKVLKGRDDDLNQLELSLGAVLIDDGQLETRLIEAAPIEENGVVDEQRESKAKEKFDTAIAVLPKSTKEISLLAAKDSALYPLLCQALLAAAGSSKLPTQLFEHPVLSDPIIRATFILRFSLGSFPALAKEAALNTLRNDIDKADLVDYQSLLPYLLIAVLDASKRVRCAAISCVALIYSKYNKIDRKARKTTTPEIFGKTTIYGEENAQVKWLSFDELYKLFNAISDKGIEGCGIDSNQIIKSFSHGVGSLKGGVKRSVLAYYASHILNAPLLGMKTSLLKLMNDVEGSARTELLLPLFTWWKGVKKEFDGVAEEEIMVFQEQLLGTVDRKDHGDGVGVLVNVIKGAATEEDRKFAVQAGERLKKLWIDGLRPEVQPTVAMSLLRLIVGTRPNLYEVASAEALDVLRGITLSSDIYKAFLDEVVPDHPADNLRQTSKRRRSFNKDAEARLPQQMKDLTIVLELLEGDQPERFPELLTPMFLVLVKALSYAEASPLGGDYMIQVLLSCLSGIVDGYKTHTPNKVLDSNSVRADVIVNCIRSTSSPQLQNIALLLIANLADIAPDVVLHSVMPIFTFMGANVLRQDDEYSAHVIEQTIHRVIPPLLQSLKSHSGGLTSGISEILSNFVAAFEHVPAHRRMKLFLELSRSLGGNEWLYAMLLLLGEKANEERAAGRHMAVTIGQFCEGFAGMFGADEQLGSFVKYLDVCVDLASDSPNKDTIGLFRDKTMGEEQVEGLVVGLLGGLSSMLASRKLKVLVANAQREEGETVGLLKGYFVEAVKHCLQLGQAGSDTAAAAELCLKALLDLLPIPLFVNITAELIKDDSSPYRTGILATFKNRISSETKKSSQDAAIGFLPELAALLQKEDSPVALRAEAISCVSVMTDKYGKEKQDAIAAMLETITGNTAFGGDDQGVQVLSAICLVSMVRCLGGRIIPALPKIAPPALGLLEHEMASDSPLFLIHNAVYPLLEDLVKTIPNFMPSYLERMLKVSYLAAAKQREIEENSDSEDEDDNEDVAAHLVSAPVVRAGLFAAVADKLPAKAIVKSVLSSYAEAAKVGAPALKELFVLLKRTIERAPRADFASLQDFLFKIFLQALDIRNTLSSSSSAASDEEEIETVETMVFESMLQMIFKLNDKVFRPFFASMLRWSTGSEENTLSRQQTFYGFFNAFLEKLGSIVTNYYATVLSNAVTVLENALSGKLEDSPAATRLYTLVLTSLIKSFANDQDDYWQNPANFQRIQPVLCSQMDLASANHTRSNPLPTSTLLITAIAELSLTAHNEANAKTINSAVMSKMRDDDGGVRLLGVQMMAELYERHKEEWIALLPESMPVIAELMEDDVEEVERAVQALIVKIEGFYGESLESLLT